MIKEEEWNKINSDDRCLINAFTMNIISYLMDHGRDINNNVIDNIQETLFKFYNTIKTENSDLRDCIEFNNLKV